MIGFSSSRKVVGSVSYRVVEYISYRLLRMFNDRGVYLSGLVHGEEKVEILKARGLEGNRSISS